MTTLKRGAALLIPGIQFWMIPAFWKGDSIFNLSRDSGNTSFLNPGLGFSRQLQIRQAIGQNYAAA